MKMIKGAKVPKADVIKEEYEIDDKWLTGNVDANKISMILRDFIMMNDALFLVIEYPSSLDDERTIPGNVLEKEENGRKAYSIKVWHKNIYYMDALTREKALEILDKYGEIFIDDGYCYFGFGNREFDEVAKTKYNIMYAYSKEDLVKYEEIFKRNGLKRTDSLQTAWEQFSEENPGESVADPRTKGAMKELLEDGMCLAKIVEDK